MARRNTQGLVAVVGLIAAVIVVVGHNGPSADLTDDVASSVVAPTVDAPPPSSPAARPSTTVPSAAEQAAAAKAAADKAAAARRAASSTWSVTTIVDGDTIWVARGGERYKIRIIGIDTPEAGNCGFAEATNNLRRVIGGHPVVLTAGARDDADRYGRLLRYVDVGGVDAGLDQIRRGYAVARYDSRDGYGRHPRETAYVRADIASPKAHCAAPPASTSGPGSTGSTGSNLLGGGGWPLPGDRYPLCPADRPIKGNASSHIAHRPGDRYYNVTNPEECFATMSAAVAAGYRPSKV